MSSLPGYLTHVPDNQNIETRDLSNNIIKTVKCPVQTNDIFYGGTASLILSSTASVALFDIQQQKVLAELTTPPVKYVVWSTDGNNVALLSKHSKLCRVEWNEADCQPSPLLTSLLFRVL